MDPFTLSPRELLKTALTSNSKLLDVVLPGYTALRVEFSANRSLLAHRTGLAKEGRGFFGAPGSASDAYSHSICQEIRSSVACAVRYRDSMSLR